MNKSIKINMMSLALLFSFGIRADDMPGVTSPAKSKARFAKPSSRPSAKKLASVTTERAEQTNSQLERCQKEYNELLNELNKTRTSKEFRDGNPSTQELAIQLESRVNGKLRELMDIASNSR